KTGGARWQVIVSRSNPTLMAALDSLLVTGIELEQRLAGDAKEAALTATSVVCRAEAAGAIVLSDQPEVVACLANRHETARAAPVSDVRALDRVLSSLQPNIVVIDPTNKNQFELRQLMKTIVTWGANVTRKS